LRLLYKKRVYTILITKMDKGGWNKKSFDQPRYRTLKKFQNVEYAHQEWRTCFIHI